jgi:DNA modification methylase
MQTVPQDAILCGDCEEVLRSIPDNCIDLIMTSPPYADARVNTYGGVKPDDYVAWFMPKAKEFYRVLKPTGTLILNIKEKVVNGERHTYVLDLIKAMKEQGWLWTEEYIWHKKNAFPGKWPNRFRDAWERCLQFNKQKHFAMYQESVKIPISMGTVKRVKHLSAKDSQIQTSASQSGFRRRMANWKNKTHVYPTNVLHLSTETTNRHHSAVYPLTLPTWFIQLFTRVGDLVLDPFLGSGTTILAAQRLKRRSISIDINKDYCALAREALAAEQANT